MRSTRPLAAALAVALTITMSGSPTATRAQDPDANGEPEVEGGPPILVPPAFRSYSDVDGVHIIGQYDAEGGTGRRRQVTLHIAWRQGSQPIHSLHEPIYLETVVPYTRTPLHVVVSEDVSAADTVDWWFSSRHDLEPLYPVGGLDITLESFVDKTATGTIENDAVVDGTNVIVYAAFRNGAGAVVDTAASDPIATLPRGETTGFTLSAHPDAEAAASVDLWAETLAGPYLTNWENHFADVVPFLMFYDSILGLARARIVTGCNGGNFCPHNGVTRAQMATFLDRALELPDTDIDYFGDDDGHWAEDSINRLAEAGISDGCNTDMFCPNGRVNRGQIAKVIVLGYGVPSSSVDAFTDDETSTTEAYHNAMAAAGLAKGCNAFTRRYCPNRQLTRAEMAGFLFRAEGLAP